MSTQLGLIVPLVGAGTDVAHVRGLLDAGTVGSVWVRDLPVTAADDADSGQLGDPFFYLGRLCGADGLRRGLVGTASVVLGLRHPLVMARAAAGAAVESDGRFVLGIGSGGKPEMNEALGIAGRSREEFAQQWRRFRSAMRALGNESGTTPHGLSLHLPADFRPPPVQLASSDVRRWEAIDGDADGWQTFLTDDRARFERDHARVCALRGHDTEVVLRLDVELVSSDRAGPEPQFTLAPRGRVRCSADQLLALVAPWLGEPVSHLLVRLHGHQPVEALVRLRTDWPD